MFPIPSISIPTIPRACTCPCPWFTEARGERTIDRRIGKERAAVTLLRAPEVPRDFRDFGWRVAASGLKALRRRAISSPRFQMRVYESLLDDVTECNDLGFLTSAKPMNLVRSIDDKSRSQSLYHFVSMSLSMHFPSSTAIKKRVILDAMKARAGRLSKCSGLFCKKALCL